MLIEIEGYQSIEHPVQIEVNGLTVVTGESNIGKSSLQRAFTGALINQRGNHFVNRRCKTSKTSIQNRGHSLSWIKGDKVTEYIIDGQPSRKAGRSTPTDEIALLGFHELIAQGRPYYPQISKQGAPPFIIAEDSPTVAAELIAASKNGQILSRAIQLAQSDLKEIQARINVRESDLERTQNTLEALRPQAETLDQARQSANDSHQAVKLITTRATILRNLNQRYQQAQSTTQFLRDLPDTIPDVHHNHQLPQFRRAYHRYSQAQQTLEKLQTLQEVPKLQSTRNTHIRQLQSLNVRYQTAQRTHQILDQPTPELPDPNVLATQNQRLNRMRAMHHKKCQAEQTHQETTRQQQHTNDQLQALEQNLRQLLISLGHCPTCGNTIEAPHHAEH
jgi:energy-coupling factor transporter ATP-binding protein EcfA2